MDSSTENQLTRILSDLNKVEGIASSLIADNNGNVISHNVSQRIDTSLFGPMAHVIMSSSERLLNSSNGGEIQRVLVESKEGKALFLHLESTYFVVLMELSANVGLVMVSAKRVIPEIVELTKNMVQEMPVEKEVITPEKEVLDVSEETKMSELENEVLNLSDESESDILETGNSLDETSESNDIIETGKSLDETSESDDILETGKSLDEISESDNILKAEELNSQSDEASEESEDEITLKAELDVESDDVFETEDLKKVAAEVIGNEKLDEIFESEEFKALDAAEAKEELAEILGAQPENEAEEMEVQNKAVNTDSGIEDNNLKSELEIKEAQIKAEIDNVLAEIKENERKSKIGEVNSANIQVYEDIRGEIEETGTEIVHEPKVEEFEEDIQEKSEVIIPVIKPPISFPKLPENVKIPSGDKEKSDLILDIYEAIFLAMSIGASKIMGVSPARGIIRKFLPLDDCKILLEGVDVKSNSVVDFDKIRGNAENIPLNEREYILITDFSKIISIITENYGKVMGYVAFRGIVRTEFQIINTSYGNAMDELGIKDKIHPELIDLFK